MNDDSSEARKTTRVGHLLGAPEAAHRHVDEPARRALGVLGEQLAQQRRVDRAGGERVDAHALARELDAHLARHREHAALGGRVGDLRGRGAERRDERGGVDDRSAAALEQVRDAVAGSTGRRT